MKKKNKTPIRCETILKMKQHDRKELMNYDYTEELTRIHHKTNVLRDKETHQRNIDD